jgi:[ribosomal protein S5]-alanine N-acetyltransferase
VAAIKVMTQRLALIAATAELARAAFADRARFAAMLKARVTEEWPPPLTEDVQEFTALALEADADLPGWLAWYFVERTQRILIGQGGFKGRPNEEGAAEIGYSLIPSFQRRGYATEAAAGLIDWAFGHAEVKLVVAETLPHLRDSIRVMQKNGMRFLLEDKGRGIVRYGLWRGESPQRRSNT